MMRTDDLKELIEAAPMAFVLAAVIATRARFMPGVSLQGLHRGEAFLGDWKQCGMTRQQYRTALAQLEKWRFATIRSTSRGTVARLMDSRLFDPLNESRNEPANHQATIDQPSANHQPTTNNKVTQKHRNTETLKKGLGLSRSAPEPLTLDFEAECFRLAEEHALDGEFVSAFIDQHQRDGWTAPNRRTGQREPIRFLDKAIVAFCEKLEADRSGETFPAAATARN